MQARMSAAQEKMPQPPPPFSFAPLEKAVMESIAEGIVVFDSFGRLLYANQNARRLVEGLDELATVRPDVLRRRLAAVGGRTKRLQVGGAQFGDAVILPASENDSGEGGGGGAHWPSVSGARSWQCWKRQAGDWPKPPGGSASAERPCGAASRRTDSTAFARPTRR